MRAPQNPQRWPLLYWFRFSGEGLPVSMPALPSTPHFRWRRLYGVQWGRWFVGAIEGGPGSAWQGPNPSPFEQSKPDHSEAGRGA